MKVWSTRVHIHLSLVLLAALLILVWLPGQAWGEQPADHDSLGGDYSSPSVSEAVYEEEATPQFSIQSEFAGGDGTEGNPYRINTAEQLYNVRNQLNAHYILIDDIDLSGFSEDGGWMPIGTSNQRFTGTFDGSGYKIQNLFIDRENQHYVGLFGAVGNGAVIKNVGLGNVNVTGKDYVGALVGYNNGGKITGSSVHVAETGAVTGGRFVGGLVGYNYLGIIEASYATGTVFGNEVYVGGLVGSNQESHIKNSYATGTVSGSDFVGGLVGYHHNNSAYYECIIKNSYATGEVQGASSVGGLVGRNSAGIILASYATGNVSDTGGDSSGRVGGLVGYNEVGDIRNSYATSNVSGSANVGGLVGYNSDGTIENSYATGTVSGSDFVGGLVGYHHNNSAYYECIIKNSYATGEVQGDDEVGGLVGENYGGTIENSYANGPVSGSDLVGGLVGNNNGGDITGSYATGGVEGTAELGGLVGTNKGTIAESYAIGTVSGSYNWVGGLVGSNSGTIKNSYATGKVEGNEAVGGLVGANSGTITNTYAIGAVFGSENTGGLVGSNNSDNITGSYYLDPTDNDEDKGKGVPKTDAEMKKLSTFEGWDFENVWYIHDGKDYPRLRWEKEAWPDHSGFTVDIADQDTIIADVEFELSITEAKGIFGNVLNGEVNVKVSSDEDEEVHNGTVIFTGGKATVPITLNVAGNHTLYVQVEGITSTQQIQVEVIALLKRIEIKKPPSRTEYFVGETLDLSGLEVIGYYSDGSDKILKITMEHISGFDSSTPATNRVVTVTYEGKEATFTVDIVEPE